MTISCTLFRSANKCAPDFVALGSFIEKIEDDNCCDYTTRELYDMLFKLESKRQETASTSSDRTTWCYPMTISWDMEQHTQYLHQQHMHLHRQHMRKLRDEERTQMDVDDTENTNNNSI